MKVIAAADKHCMPFSEHQVLDSTPNHVDIAYSSYCRCISIGNAALGDHDRLECRDRNDDGRETLSDA